MAATMIRVPSQSDRNSDGYEVKLGKDDNWYCTCPAWRFQKAPKNVRVCKHMRTLADQARQLGDALDRS